jgi:hypothetical protein
MKPAIAGGGNGMAKQHRLNGMDAIRWATRHGGELIDDNGGEPVYVPLDEARETMKDRPKSVYMIVDTPTDPNAAIQLQMLQGFRRAGS